MKNVLILPRLANDQEYIVSLCGDLEINYTPKLFMWLKQFQANGSVYNC